MQTIGDLENVLGDIFTEECSKVFRRSFQECAFYGADKLETIHLLLGLLGVRAEILPIDILQIRQIQGPGTPKEVDYETILSKTVIKIVNECTEQRNRYKFSRVIFPILVQTLFSQSHGLHKRFLDENNIDTNQLVEVCQKQVQMTVIKLNTNMEDKINWVVEYIDSQISSLHIKLNKIIKFINKE